MDVNSMTNRSIFSNPFRAGRPVLYNHRAQLNYRLPFEYFPYLDFINAELAINSNTTGMQDQPQLGIFITMIPKLTKILVIYRRTPMQLLQHQLLMFLSSYLSLIILERSMKNAKASSGDRFSWECIQYCIYQEK
jgi:hypothetical protein